MFETLPLNHRMTEKNAPEPFMQQMHFFKFEFELLIAQPCRVSLLSVKSGESLTHDVMYISATRTGRVHDVIDFVKMAPFTAMFLRLSSI